MGNQTGITRRGCHRQGLTAFVGGPGAEAAQIDRAHRRERRIRNVQPPDGGTYTVVVRDTGGATTSDLTSLIVILPTLAFANDLADAVTVPGTTGEWSGEFRHARERL